MFYKIVMIVGGIALGVYGVKEFIVSRGTSSVAADVKLADLEAGQSPPNNYVKLDEHIPFYPAMVFSYRGRSGDENPAPSTKVSYAYYPIISPTHPFMQALAELEGKVNEQGELPPGVEMPVIDKFAVLVKTEKFDTVGDLPETFERASAIEGLIINDIDSLDDDEEKLIQQSFPALDLDEVLILEEDRKPASALKSWGLMIGGAALGLAGVALLFKRSKPPAAAQYNTV